MTAICDTFATQGFLSPVSLGRQSTFPGAMARAAFADIGTAITVWIVLRLNESA